MVELRRRKGPSPEDNEGPSDSPPASSPDKNKPSTGGGGSGGGRIPLLVLAFLFLAITAGYTIKYRATNPYLGSPDKPRIYSAAELAKFTGERKNTPAWWPGRREGHILLGCMGKVFDVTPGHRHYGPGGGYSFFAGKDASRSFVTGDFQNDLTDDIADLRPEDIAAILHWREFYENHKDYTIVGVVAGRFYNTQGEPLPLLNDIENIVEKYKAQEAAKEAAAKVVEVLCNVSWKKNEGGWVYCDDGMVPRKVEIPPSSSSLENSSGVTSVQERCVCVGSNEKVTEGRRVYDGCHIESSRCQTSVPGED